MAHFSIAKDAVLCAMEIQEIIYHEPEVHVRIGIHFGEVMFENRDVFGDGVNIASRNVSLLWMRTKTLFIRIGSYPTAGRSSQGNSRLAG